MMKKWFFSDNGKVTSPLSHTEALTYLADKPNAYGWHPSFSQWKPISCIPEFSDVVSLPEQPSLVTKELTDKFLAKKLRLETKLSSIEDSINHTESTFSKFEKQINNYKALTQNLSDEVKGAISNIEKKYEGLNKKILQVKNAVSIAEVEMNDAIKAFDNRANSNDVSMPSCHNITKNITTSEINNAEFKQQEREADQISKAKLAQTKLATPHKRLDSDVKQIETQTSKEVRNTSQATNEAVIADKVTKQTVTSDIEHENKETKETKETKESFNGMKSMMKSVFKADKKVESETKEQQPMSMAERLKMAQNNG